MLLLRIIFANAWNSPKFRSDTSKVWSTPVVIAGQPDPADCLLWVKRAVLTFCQRLPVCPEQRTSSGRPGWSGSCQQATFRSQKKGAHLSGLIQSAVKFICNAFALFGAEIRHNCQILDMVRDGRPKGEIFRENGLAIREQ
jgi:hypothetical protein